MVKDLVPSVAEAVNPFEEFTYMVVGGIFHMPPTQRAFPQTDPARERIVKTTVQPSTKVS
jgi:hypothetical protein